MKIILCILSILFFSIINCTGLKEVHNTNFEIKILEINSWLNLMPGGPGSFHLSGEFAIHSEPGNMIMDLNLNEILVYANQELLYKIKPLIQYSRTEPDYSLNNQKIEVYQFYTESGLEIREVLMGENKINVELTFTVDDDEVIKKLNDVELTRAY